MASIILDSIVFDPATQIAQIKLIKVADDGTEQPHRTTVLPGVDPNEQMRVVNDHLVQMGFPKLTGQPLAQIRTAVAQRHTPAVIAAFQARKDPQRNPRG